MAKEIRELELLKMLGGVYSFYEKELTEFHHAVWVRALSGFDLQAVTAVFDAHMMDPESGKWLPKPADIVKLLQGTRAERSSVAWGLVLQATQRVGSYATVAFEDPVTHCVIEDLGGWPALCRTTYDELPFVEARFHKAYAAHAKAGTLHAPTLIGITDASNGLRGFSRTEPVLIGNPGLAMRTIQSGSEVNRIGITRASDALPISGPSLKRVEAKYADQDS